MSQTLTASTVVSEQEINLEIAQLRRDGGTQSRAKLDIDAINDYAEAIKAGDKFPAVDVYYDGTNYWLVDGFHRIEAALVVGLKTFQAFVHQGTLRDAVLYSVGANAKNALRRTNLDKRRAVVRLLSDPEWSQWSRNQIAKQCGVDEKLVRDIQNKLSSELPKIDSESAKAYGIDEQTLKKAQWQVKNPPDNYKANRKGKEYTVDTSKIGQHMKKETSAVSTLLEPSLATSERENLPRVRQTVLALHKQEIVNRQNLETEDSSSAQPATKTQEDNQPSWWQLGKHLLFNGHPTSREFQQRIELENIACSILLPPWDERCLENPPQSNNFVFRFACVFSDLDWDSIKIALEKILEAATESGDLIVFYFFPQPEILTIANSLGCHCIIAEPDKVRCQKILAL